MFNDIRILNCDLLPSCNCCHFGCHVKTWADISVLHVVENDLCRWWFDLNSFQMEYKNHITRLKKDRKKMGCRGESEADEVRENYRVIYGNYSSVGNLQSYLCAFDKTAALWWDPMEVCRFFQKKRVESCREKYHNHYSAQPPSSGDTFDSLYGVSVFKGHN